MIIDDKTTEERSEIETAETEPPPAPPAPVRKKRGFATWTPEERVEAARKGGRAAHASGTAHQWTSEEARRAGILGGRAVHVSRGPQKRRRAPAEGQGA